MRNIIMHSTMPLMGRAEFTFPLTIDVWNKLTAKSGKFYCTIKSEHLSTLVEQMPYDNMKKVIFNFYGID